MIEQSVHNIYESDNFQNYLKVLSKFHNYSLNNVILILSQYPSASLVAGYNSWRDNFHRYVNKGEKAIKILAPYQVTVKKILDDIDELGNKTQTEEEVKITKFRVVNVFDINQTNGEPIADLDLVSDLKGTSNNARALVAAINEVCQIPIEFKHTKEDSELIHGAKGYYSITEDKIVVNRDLEDIQIAKTLTHEYAHSLLHKDTKKSQSQREIEAESLAFVLCDHFGLDTSEYSFGYIASYADKDFDELKSILVNIQSTAHEMIEQLEPVFKEKLHMIEMKSKYITPLEMEQMNHDIVIQVSSLMEQYKDALNDPNVSTSDIHEMVDQQIYDVINSKLEYSDQAFLFGNNHDYYQTLRTICFEAFTDPNFDLSKNWFIENSIEHRNYELFEQIAQPLLTNDAYYMKYATPGFMDLNVEIIDENRFAMAHNYELNGDLMADPDIEFTVDKDNRLLYPQSYQQDNLQFYERVDGDPFRANELNRFMNQWIHNIQEQKYKVETVYTDEFELSTKENPSGVRKFCKEHGIAKMAPKNKELER